MDQAMNAGQEGQQPRPAGLRQWVKDRGISFAWLAQKTGISYPCLMNYVHGKNAWPEGAREKIAAALNVPVEELPN
jgi:lambda repressor-like predicted transcriptional regulator